MKRRRSTKMGAALLLVAAGVAMADATPDHYVNASNPIENEESPFDNWAIAARSIQNAINVAAPGDTVWVTNGTYNSGGDFFAGVTNRVCITNTIRVISINGPAYTTIDAFWPTWEVRGAYVASNALLAGFTIQNAALAGATEYGAGVLGNGAASVVSNCVIVGNQAYARGAGAEAVTLVKCVISNNIAGFQAGCAVEGEREGSG